MFGLTDAELEALRLSLLVASVATVVSLPVGVLVGLALARGRFWGKSALNILVHLPLVLPPVVTGYVLLILFGRNGAIGAFLADRLGIVLAFHWTGAALAAAIMSFPLMVRAIRLAIEAIDERLEEAAGTLGTGRVATFMRITLPLAFPGILAGAVLGFARAIGEFGATVTFVASIPGETRTLPSAIYNLLQVPGGESGAIRLAVIAIIVAAGALIASELLAKRVRRKVVGA